MRSLAMLAHNCIAHPVAGVLWFVGLRQAGDHVHEWWFCEEKTWFRGEKT